VEDHEHVPAAEPPTPLTAAPARRDAAAAGPATAGGEPPTVGGPDATPGDVLDVGDAAVDEALRELDGLARRPLAEHVRVFDAVHGALQDRLAEAQG